MRLLLPLLLGLAGLCGGALAGHLLRPAPPEETAPAPEARPEATGDPLAPLPVQDPAKAWDYVKLDNQFVVPVMADGRVDALVILSISLEVRPGQGTAVLQREPKLRDAFLRALFEHERTGGFAGTFTAARAMAELRLALLKAARAVAGEAVNDVLVTDILRQDV